MSSVEAACFPSASKRAASMREPQRSSTSEPPVAEKNAWWLHLSSSRERRSSCPEADQVTSASPCVDWKPSACPKKSPPTEETDPRGAPEAFQICQRPVQASPIEEACDSAATFALPSVVASKHASPPPCSTVTVVVGAPGSGGTTPAQANATPPPPASGEPPPAAVPASAEVPASAPPPPAPEPA